MKKLLLLLTILLIFIISSCDCRLNDSSNGKYKLKYVVYFPNNSRTYTVYNNCGFYWDSNKGTNYIKCGSITGPTVYSGSAPYEIIEYIEIK